MHAKLLQSCLTLWDSMDCNLSDSLIHEMLQARILMCCHFLLQVIFLTQGSNPPYLMSPALAGGFVTTSATLEALLCFYSSPILSPLSCISCRRRSLRGFLTWSRLPWQSMEDPGLKWWPSLLQAKWLPFLLSSPALTISFKVHNFNIETSNNKSYKYFVCWILIHIFYYNHNNSHIADMYIAFLRTQEILKINKFNYLKN